MHSPERAYQIAAEASAAPGIGGKPRKYCDFAAAEDAVQEALDERLRGSHRRAGPRAPAPNRELKMSLSPVVS